MESEGARNEGDQLNLPEIPIILVIPLIQETHVPTSLGGTEIDQWPLLGFTLEGRGG